MGVDSVRSRQTPSFPHFSANTTLPKCTTYAKSKPKDQQTQKPVAVGKTGRHPEQGGDDQRQVEGLFASIGICEHAPEHGTKHHAHKHGARENPDVFVLDLELCCCFESNKFMFFVSKENPLRFGKKKKTPKQCSARKMKRRRQQIPDPCPHRPLHCTLGKIRAMHFVLPKKK